MERLVTLVMYDKTTRRHVKTFRDLHGELHARLFFQHAKCPTLQKGGHCNSWLIDHWLFEDESTTA